MANIGRLGIKVTGESGQGINAIGEIVAKALKKVGYNTFGYREYPSLIQGGYASHQIDVSDRQILAPSREVDIMLSFSRVSFHKYLPTLREGGQAIHMLPKLTLSKEEGELVDHKRIRIAHLPAVTEAIAAGGKPIMANVVMIGALWRLLGQPPELLEEVVKSEFAHKPTMIEPNLACLQRGYAYALQDVSPITMPFEKTPERSRDGLLTGNHLLSLGAMAAGVRAYFAYPMTPSSSILTYLADTYHETGMLVKQIDDEISVAQMAIGAMFAGTRALVATSGGGFDLMTESVSLAGMTETPFVCVIGQRPGPATGLPTWTAASDLNLAVHAGHGEFPRCVIAMSDPASAYLVVQNAFNIAEKYQIPVLVLTEKEIAESLFQVADLPQDVPIERHLPDENELAQLKPADRYKTTETGISPRWLPGQIDATYDANSDEHTADGTLTEDADATRQMYTKRLAKLNTLQKELPEPELLGPANAALTFVGWGSVRNTLSDAMDVWNENHTGGVNYLHYEYVYPLKTETLQSLIEKKQRLVLIENNMFGQLGGLLTRETGYQFSEKFLKCDGRPFFVEDVLAYLEAHA